ncbi:MAG: Nif3-like dinuclear metal center hexameric protein [Solirubrobacteraceae bacterium]
MAALDEILADLDGLLEPAGFDDYCPNGLQVIGRAEINTLVTGVSAHLELFDRALAAGADLILTHHGLFWNGDDRRVTGPLHRRLRLLLANDLGLAAYHLPLDAHPECGNNALIAAGLGGVDRRPFGLHRGREIGCRARFPGDGLAAAELVARVERLTGRPPLAFTAGPDAVRTVGIVSGAGCSHLGEAIAAGLDAFITGEPAERAMAEARESRIHFLAAGHYATETFGVRALGDRLADRFGIRHIFVDVPNPI